VRHRDSTLGDTVYAGWRELEVHTVDLALDPTSDDWSREFCLHLLDFLRPRTPDNTRLVLRAGETTWENGTGEPRIPTGKLTDLTAWLGGRTPQNPIDGDPPELTPWP
jgi:maleylpyruvate isomerase